jgi:hypothetical protein
MPSKAISVFETPHHRMKGDRAALSLTVELLFDRYTKEGRHLPDGSLKTEGYLDHVRQTGRYLAKFFGRDQLVSELTPDRIQDYVVWRRRGGVAHRRVGANTIQRDLGMFKAALNWACQKYEGGHPLLTRHALEKVRIPTEKDPKRPLFGAGIHPGTYCDSPERPSAAASADCAGVAHREAAERDPGVALERCRLREGDDSLAR